MNKQELGNMIAEILREMGTEPMVKGSDYKPTRLGPQPQDRGYSQGDFVPDITALDLRKLYLTENPANKEGYMALKEQTSARLALGRAGPRYQTLSMLRFWADHAAAQDAVFSEIDESFPREHNLIGVQTRCKDKEEFLARPDLGRSFDEKTTEEIRAALPHKPKVQLVIGDGLSANAILANAIPCAKALQQGLQKRGISMGQGLYVKYCRVGAGDAVGDITDCDVVCVFVGERPGLVTAESMSAYITYNPHKGVSESARTVVSNIHDTGTTATQAGEKIAGLIEKMLEKKVSGVALQGA